MKGKELLLLTFILLITPILLKAQEPDWLVKLKQQEWLGKASQIKLLKTSKSEVRRMLGEPVDFDPKVDESDEDYNIKNGKVWVQYTTEQCTSADGKIEKDIVEEIDFDLEKTISFSELVTKLKIPIKRFKRSGTDVADSLIYENFQDGITISTLFNNLKTIRFSIPKYKKYNCVSLPIFLNDLERIKQIKLLKSNRNEIRQIFADYKLINDSQSKYKDLFYGNSTSFEFTYSEGNCEFEDSDGYNTSEYNVESIKISPYYDFNPKEIDINLSQYTKEKIHKNISGVYIYHDKQKGISFKTNNGNLDFIEIFPPQKYYSLMCSQKKAKILSANKSIFTEKLKDRIYKFTRYANVEKLHLSQTELTLNCKTSEKPSLCQNIQPIKVFVQAVDPENDYLTYNYTISGGKIIGKDNKVYWDLSGVKAGTYTITAAVDDGCGFCGKTITKKVVVKECSDCKNQ